MIRFNRLRSLALGESDLLRCRLQATGTGLVFFTFLGLDGVEQTTTAALAEVDNVDDHGRHSDAGPGVGVLHRVIHFHGWSSALVQGCVELRLSSCYQFVLDS